MRKIVEAAPIADSLPDQDKTAEIIEYKKPELKVYGGISELVQMNFGGGTDGGAPPLQFT